MALNPSNSINLEQLVLKGLKQKFSEEAIGLCEEMGLPPISELFTNDRGWAQVCRQRVPDDGGCNMEAPLAELGPGPRNQHVSVQPNGGVPAQILQYVNT